MQERENSDTRVSLPLHDRSFDLVLLSNWENQIIYEPDDEDGSPSQPAVSQAGLTNPLNKSLESGVWTQSIIWGSRVPFREFTQLELNDEDLVQEDRPSSKLHTRLLHDVS